MSEPREISFVAPDVTQLKALAHPVRVTMLGILRMDGPSTATRLAERLGLNTGATSYHLRQLAQHGFVEEAGEQGNKRDRWWRAVHESTTTGPADLTDNAAREAMGPYWQAVGYAQLDSLAAAFRERSTIPLRWQDVSAHSDWWMWLTPDQTQELMSRIHALLGEYAGRAPADRSQAAPEAEQVIIQLHGFPRPGTLTGADAS
ncbi:transcriptional regulator [Microlunatus sp. Gsoil 973]|uniref:ArsR/SmtB family transcription factor n=1 Tax=Microlunatus sp. Gsoil 973 TaxID=2672569 RepID=UPI001E3822B6|nr:helix-turn-helix domain-containing protein [Microlunatus sp. Gsoil 973]